MDIPRGRDEYVQSEEEKKKEHVRTVYTAANKNLSENDEMVGGDGGVWNAR